MEAPGLRIVPTLQFMKILDEQEQLKTDEPARPMDASPEVSVFLPVFNEEPNLLPLHAKHRNLLGN